MTMKVWTRILGVLAGAAVALAALTMASAQQEPPFRFYGYGSAGDTVGVTDGSGVTHTAAADAEGAWYIDVEAGAQDGADNWTLNGGPADATISNASASQAQVSLVAAPVHEDGMLEEGSDDDSMMEDDDSMMEDGGMLEDEAGDDMPPMEEDDSMMEDDDSMMEDDDSMMEEDDDSMMEEGSDDDMMDDGAEGGMMDDEHGDDGMMDDGMGEDVGMPATGTGGLAAESAGGVSAGLIGLLLALGAAAIAGIGIRRVRNRA